MSLKSLILAAAVLAAAALPAAAQNLIVNPGFATDISHWTLNVTFVTAAWQALDATGQPGSGSIAITNTFPGLSNGVGQCVLVTAGKSYAFGASVEVPSGQLGDASLTVVWFTGADCGGQLAGNQTEGPFVEPGDNTFSAVAASAAAPAGAQSAQLLLAVGVSDQSTSSVVGYFDDVYFQPSGGCTPTATNLCLNQGRFKIAATFDAGGGNAGQAQAVALTGDTGYLWFFDASNVEVVVKVLDGCPIGGHYWVFAGGLTNVAVVITAIDTQTGAMRTYSNPQGKPFQPLQDTAAFSTCP